MDGDFMTEGDLKARWQKTGASIETEGHVRTIKNSKNNTGSRITMALSGLASAISFVFLIFGIGNGFWSGVNTTFSLYALITSPLGIILLFGYLLGLNVFYFQLVEIRKSSKLENDRS